MNASAVKIVCCLTWYIFAVGTLTPTVEAASSNKLPKGFVRCKLSERSTLNECIKNGLQSAVPLLVKGIPSLGLLPTDPMRITTLRVDQGVGAVQLKLTFRDLDILNMHSTIIKDLEYEPNNQTLRVTLSVQKPIILEGQYEANGKVLILPVVGNGTCKIILDGYKSYSVVKMKETVKNGNTFLHIEDIKWKFTTTKMHMKLENLFNGDKILGENMNVFLNENWRELLSEMQPTFEQALSAAFISLGQQFFNRVPLNEIFAD